jgi:hypothetical protein
LLLQFTNNVSIHAIQTENALNKIWTVGEIFFGASALAAVGKFVHGKAILHDNFTPYVFQSENKKLPTFL